MKLPLAMITNAMSSVFAAVANATNKSTDVVIPDNVIDLRKQSGHKNVYGKRLWKKTTGVTLHQTACVLGERPERWLNVGCHIGVTRSGKILWLHDFTDLVTHGHGWNKQCVGFEIDGLYAGIQDKPNTVWDNPDTPHHEKGMDIREEQMYAVRAAIRWVHATIAAHGGNMTALVAHRQSTDDRRTDPGSGIWQAVAIPLHEELNLSDGGPGFTIGKGQPIPEAWNPTRKGFKY